MRAAVATTYGCGESIAYQFAGLLHNLIELLSKQQVAYCFEVGAGGVYVCQGQTWLPLFYPCCSSLSVGALAAGGLKII